MSAKTGVAEAILSALTNDFFNSAGGEPDPITESSMEADSVVNGDTPKSEKSEIDASNKKEDTESRIGSTSAATNRENDKKGSESAKMGRSLGTASALNKTYMQIIMEAIVDMKDRTGSSLAAIKKWIGIKYPELILQPQFVSNLNKALRNGLGGKPPKLVKVRASYKISTEFKESVRNRQRRAKAAQAAASKKKKEENVGKRKEDAFQRRLENLTPEEAETLQKVKQDEENRKKANEAKAKERADRLRRRRFPMEDTKLHHEDKVLNIKPQADVLPRPHLPYFWNLTMPLLHPSRKGKTSEAVLRHSKVEGLDSDTRGLVPDLLAVYHFFRGDVHFTLGGNQKDESVETRLVPEFSLQHLVFAVEQILNGHARRAKLVPPLIVHLFVTCLQILCQPFDGDDEINASLGKIERRLRDDLSKYLLPAVTPVSWSDIVALYMDTMERFYATDASRDPSVLQPLPVDINYLLGRTEEPCLMATPGPPIPSNMHSASTQHTPPSHHLPQGYKAYLGDPNSTLYKAHAKLARQDPWSLSGEELMALLRALTEDVLATHPAASRDLAHREAEMQELLRAKRSADIKFRKVRLAFEGPKKVTSKPKTKDGEDTDKNGEEKQGDDAEEGKAEEEEKPFKPTVSKRQFEAAKKSQEKANDAYEKGIRKLVARTEAIGRDRNWNSVYCFRHDPEILYVEDKKPLVFSHTTEIPPELQFSRYSWHIIESTSLFDQFVGSLDVRGRREHALYEELLGTPGTNSSLRKFLLHDNVKEEAAVRAKIKEMESLKERLIVARIKCDEEQGRRSGRLAGQAEIELAQIQMEIDDVERLTSGKKEPESQNFEKMTGLEILRIFETAGRVETRRTREKKLKSKARKLPLMSCSNLISTGNIDGSGPVGMIVASLLDLEEHCESLAPWERSDVSRYSWISRLESTVPAWNSICEDSSGILAGCATFSANNVMDDSSRSFSRQESLSNNSSSGTKRRKTDSPVGRVSLPPPSHSVSTILTMLKQPLLELEERVADITNVAVASHDNDVADDNMSIDGVEEDKTNQERMERAWKRLIYKLRRTPSKKQVLIRELLVSAIGAARKAHLPKVVAGLRVALLQFHPGAPGDSKIAALKLLEENGGYEELEDDESDDEEEGGLEDVKEEETPSLIYAEGAVLRSSLEGSSEATRIDWINDVKQVKTVSRLASLTAGFIKDASAKTQKIEVERNTLIDALQTWSRIEERQTKQRDDKTSIPQTSVKGPSEVWANVRFTDEICMAKAEAYPWWPAKICIAKDHAISASLKDLDRRLVGFVGEMGGLRVVRSSDIKPFTGLIMQEEIEVQYSKEIKMELDDCMVLARRILRGRRKK